MSMRVDRYSIGARDGDKVAEKQQCSRLLQYLPTVVVQQCPNTMYRDMANLLRNVLCSCSTEYRLSHGAVDSIIAYYFGKTYNKMEMLYWFFEGIFY